MRSVSVFSDIGIDTCVYSRVRTGLVERTLKGGRKMLRRCVPVFLAMTLALVLVGAALAAPPAAGTIVEGESVPGIALGYSRAQVEEAYGAPASCQGPTASFCKFLTDDGESIFLHYSGVDGGEANNTPDDVVYSITSYDKEWTTTAGVNPASALADPDAVITAYPDAQVTYNQWGAIVSVEDARQGIRINWHYNFYGDFTTVNIQIFFPREPAPPRELLTYVNDIDLSASKTRGGRTVRALVQVRDDRDLAAADAAVHAAWVLPDGSSQAVEDVTSGSGYAYFEIAHAKRGSYTLTVEDVVLDGYRFDAANSVLSASIKVR